MSRLPVVGSPKPRGVLAGTAAGGGSGYGPIFMSLSELCALAYCAHVIDFREKETVNSSPAAPAIS